MFLIICDFYRLQNGRIFKGGLIHKTIETIYGFFKNLI